MNRYSKEKWNPRQALVGAGLKQTDTYKIYEESRISEIDFETGKRAAINEKLNRLQKAQDDPALMIGTAKELLEVLLSLFSKNQECL